MDSPFSHLFGCNEVAHATDPRTLRDLLSKPLERLDYLDREIARLEQERYGVQKYVNAHKRLLSPSLRIPSEILSEIFVQCLPEDGNPICSVSEAPLLLGLVCRRWRDVCLSTWRLWSSIHVVLPKNGYIENMCATVDATRRGVEAWLNRSGSLPISFSIHGDHYHLISSQRSEQRRMDLDNEIEMFAQHGRHLFDCFTRRIRRWQNVGLRLNGSCTKIFEDSITALSDSGWQAPLLDSFTFNLLFRSNRQGLILTFLSKLLTAPNLQRVSVSGDYDTPSVLQYLRQSTSRLLQLNLLSNISSSQGLRSCESLSLRSRFTNLHACHLDIRITWVMFEPPVFLPLLRKLSLHFFNSYGDNSTVDDTFMSKVSIPALRSLTVTVESLSSVYEHLPCISLLVNSLGVRELKLGLPLSLDGYLECLALVPNVDQLAINDRGVLSKESAKILVRHLIPYPRQPKPRCPKLLQLDIVDLDVDEELMLDLACSRRGTNFEGISSLQVCRVNFRWYKRFFGNQDMLDELRQQGMEISFGYWLGETVDRSHGRHSFEGQLPFDTLSSSFVFCA